MSRLLSTSLLVTLLAPVLILAFPFKTNVTVLHEFPKGTWLENIAVRPCGSLLATVLTSPELWQVSPYGSDSPILVHTFDNATGLMGITETSPDVFHVLAGDFNFSTFTSTMGSWSLYRVDFNEKSQTPGVTLATTLPDLTLANGLTTIPNTPYIIIGDSIGGLIYSFNTHTSKVAVYFDDPLLKPVGNTAFRSGVNGVRYFKGYLYFSNTHQNLLARVPLIDGIPKGTPEVLVTGITDDDFALDQAGNVYLAENGNNDLAFLKAGSNATEVLAGSANSTVMAGATSAVFGKAGLERSLFVTTTGGVKGYVPWAFPGATFSVGGRVNRVDFY